MYKKLVFIFLALLALGATDLSAQSKFLKELGKRIEKAKPAQQQQTPPWKTYVMVPQDHTVFLEPIGSPSEFGKLGGKHISPIRKESEVKAWTNAQIGVEFSDNQRLIAEHEEYHKAVYEEGNGWEGVHVRNVNLSDEVGKRKKVLTDYYNNLKALKSSGSNVNYTLDKLTATIRSEYYKRTLNSSIAPLLPYLSEEVAAYYKSCGNPESLHLGPRTEWYPFAGVEYVKTSIENQKAFVNLDGRVEINGVNYHLYPGSTPAVKSYAVVENCDKYTVNGTDVLIPSHIVRNGVTYTVTEIRNWAFSGAGMKTVQIPNSVRKIGMSAFSWLPYLKSIIIPDSVKEIDSHCFENSPELEEVYIPDSVTKMGKGCFYKCVKLKKATIPEHLKAIKHYEL